MRFAQPRGPLRIGNESGITKKHAGRLAIGDQQALQIQDLGLRLDVGGQDEILVIRQAEPERMSERMIGPENLQPPFRLFPPQPKEILLVAADPRAGDG
jgi:hypothetical protein